MKQLSDLLDEAAAGAPPARYDVEDAVAAGRRLQRRRNTGWAIAAVTAVAVAIGVPQIATRRSVPPVQPVVTTTTSPAVKSRSFGLPFAGYTAGRFRVDDPATMTLSAARAPIRPATGSGSISGFLDVYAPSTVSVGSIFGAYKNVDSAPINGRRAVFLESTRAGAGTLTSGLAWEYTDGGWVFAWSRLARMKRADLTKVVKGLSLAQPRAARVGFRTTYVPPGYHLVQVDSPDSTGVISGLLFASATSGGQERSEFGFAAVPDDLGYDVLLQLVRPEPGERSQWPSAAPICPKAKQYCYRSFDQGRYVLQVRSARMGRAALLRTLTAVTVADPDDQGTWTDVNSAAPASAQLPAK